MAEFLEGDTLRIADQNTRRQFWQWLRRNKRDVRPQERRKLADLVIWPDEKGDLGKISDLCDPRSRRVGAVLAEFIRRPNEQVRRSGLVSADSRARTSIRRTPDFDEIANWFQSRMGSFVIGQKADADTIKVLDRFESDLLALLKDKTTVPHLQAVAGDLPALARDGLIQPRMTLVMPDRNNDRLDLPGCFMLKDRRNATALDKLAPALSIPSAEMLLNAFSRDSGNTESLQARLECFLSVTGPGSAPRHQLAKMPIIPLHGQLHKPSLLTFFGSRGDYWGAWKTRIPAKGLSPDDQRRFRTVGVTSAQPNKETSRAFFEWLAAQDQAVLESHIPCVLRHILLPEGPGHWSETFTDTVCIPARGRDGPRLFSLRAARRNAVYLPDAGNIGEDILQRDPSVFLVVDSVKEVAKPISESLFRLGIKSLRHALNEPESVFGIGNTKQADGDMIVWINKLRSSGFRHTLWKRLNELGVESELVRRDWYDRLGRIKNIQLADAVEVYHRFRKKPYRVKSDAGFDPDSGIFWVRWDNGIGGGELYKQIAKHLVFKPTAPPVYYLALKEAVALKINDPSFGHPGSTLKHSSDRRVAEDYADSNEHGDGSGTTDDPGEAGFGHSPFKPDPARNRPRSGPVPVGLENRLRHRTDRIKAAKSNQDSREPGPTPALEKEQIEDLKRNQYASHCQMCLCERPPKQLAPDGSYVEWEEVRRRVLEAHHVDLKSAGGARHVGNLILLCKYHHDNFGRRLARVKITTALQGNAEDRIICFGAGAEVRGRQIEYEVPDTGEAVKLFFTNPHADYWLRQDCGPIQGARVSS